MSQPNLPECSIIVAMTADQVIGAGNCIPWHISEDLQVFKRITSGGVVIMGRKTYQSIGKPLPNRKNLVVSRSLQAIDGVEVFADFESALQRAARFEQKIFFIGGAEIYRLALACASSMYISWVAGDYSGETKFPDYDQSQWQLIEEEKYEEFKLCFYQRQ